MASYNIIFKPSVEKDLRSLPRLMVARVFERVEALRDDPFPHRSRKPAGAEELYRIRIGDYRVIYAVDKENRQIIVHYVRHRRDAYHQL
jgi:mRNA interferase RelE/StbE